MDQIEEILTRGVEQVYPNKASLENVLRSGKKLKLYQGFDPSMSSLHLGHLVGLMKLRQFQLLGHEVIFLVGDFTGMIGDPTDKLATRPQLTRQQVLANCQSWQEQVGRVLDFTGTNPVKILYNSSWSDKVTFKDLISITANFTVQQILERAMYQKRLAEGKPIQLSEFLYPVAQAIDCVEMAVDLEVGGSDQTFNMLAGRTLMKALKNKEKFVLTTKLLVDKAGHKVGKTTSNALFLNSTPEQFYGGIMAFPDEVIALGFELLTDLPWQNLEKGLAKNPMREKKRLAFEVVSILWGQNTAKSAQELFESTYQRSTFPDNAPLIVLSGATDLKEVVTLSGVATSRTAAKNLIREGSVDVDSVTIREYDHLVDPNYSKTIRIGKTNFFRIKLKDKLK